MSDAIAPSPIVAYEPAILTIFGITGDLAHRKLLPALYYLAKNNLLPVNFRIIGTTRQEVTADAIISRIKTGLENSGESADPKILNRLQDSMSIISMSLTEPAAYKKLKVELDKLEDSVGQCLHRLFYLAVPSSVFEPIIDRLGGADLQSGCQHGATESRLLIEKPFGHDLISAEQLVETLGRSFKEKDIYRIDHYLAKETVQNIMTLRFKNPLLSSIWDGKHISHIMITAAESIGIENRVDFYEQTGALRDVIQSHLLQVLALVTMEKPDNESAEAIHAAKQALLRQVMPPKADVMANRTVRGQYASYKKDAERPNSVTETYAALHLTIDNDSWRDTPIFIRTGKQLPQKATEVTLAFTDNVRTNYLTISIQPNEGIALNLNVKKPGYSKEFEEVQMDFLYGAALDANHPDAYERVIIDALRGDKTLFATSEAVIASWHIVQPILDAWQHENFPMHNYPNGTWGPKAADTLVEDCGVSWMTDKLTICQPPVDTKKAKA